MDGTIALRSSERKALLRLYRSAPDSAVRLRAHLLLLLADGHAWATIAALLYCSTRTIARWKRRFGQGGIQTLLDERRGRRCLWGAWIIDLVTAWVTTLTPRDFGFLRSRWCCGVVVLLLAEVTSVRVSAETVRRWLHRRDLVWRRPRPVLGPRDPQRAAKLKQLRELLAHLPDDEIAVFEDEVDINLNPKIGSAWMPRGGQAQVVTPGSNEKRYLAGSLNWRTGDVVVTEGRPREGRNAALFVRHLDQLRCRYRRYRTIHVICDNAAFHDCRKVTQYLKTDGQRILLHFLPTYSPETNPIERVWWHLHEELTRNHRCRTMDELLDLTFAWLDQRRPFVVEDQTYRLKPAA
jgi:transposase